MPPSSAEPDDESLYVSTGHLPPPADVQRRVQAAFEHARVHTEGACSEVYPALARVSPELFGVSLAGVDGSLVSIGDARHPFTLMSVAKPFTFALLCEALGPAACRRLIGANATGMPFNSAAAIDFGDEGRTNPMVNSGALAAASHLPGEGLEAKWAHLSEGLARFAGHPVVLDDEMYGSAMQTHHRNHGLAWLLHGLGRLGMHPTEATELYTRQSCVQVTAEDLAFMGATLADGGVHPKTRERVVSVESCAYALAVMTTAGMYETSGDWLYEVGLPGKSGIAGGIVAVAPGKGALGSFAPLLDAAGNSVRGQLVARELSRSLGLSLFTSSPVEAPRAEARAAPPSSQWARGW
ncbi:glutaminase A [Sandaracinus amylolyticus]|uniref:glutaminase A n=1 Tax=Sandaracinus amylolyticus TaxID=927083 RepID=UPI001F47E670|nr:glutaminase A [Sandaracinus amylolyticus]UJR85757.1 Hypothetical protein I5071_78370 [Sandaracinus amylolyticus]